MPFKPTNTNPTSNSSSVSAPSIFPTTAFKEYNCEEWLVSWDKACKSIDPKIFGEFNSPAPVYHRWQNNPRNQVPIEFQAQQDPDSDFFISENLSWFVIPNTPEYGKLLKIQVIPNIKATKSDVNIPVELRFSCMVNSNNNLISQSKDNVSNSEGVWLNNLSYRTILTDKTVSSGLLDENDLAAMSDLFDHWSEYGPEAMYTRGSEASNCKLWLKNDNYEECPYLAFFRLSLLKATDNTGKFLGFPKVGISDLIWLPGNVLFGYPSLNKSHNIGANAGRQLVLTDEQNTNLRRLNLPNFF